MALADFIQALQEQDVVYSEPAKSSIRVIPPENAQQTIRVLPPETSNDVPDHSHVSPTNNIENNSASKPKIKIKIRQKPADAQMHQSVSSKSETELKNDNTVNVQPVVEKPPIVQEIPDQPIVSDPVPTKSVTNLTKPEEPEIPKVDVNPSEPTDDDIFNSTGTEYSKKEIWMQYFQKAKSSRKSNVIVERMKAGRFTITPDNKILLLPDYDIVGKDPDDVLKDKWF